MQAAQRLLDELACSDAQACVEDDALLLEKVARLSQDRADNLLRHWLRGRMGAYPSEAQLMELQQQMLHASSDSHPLMDIGGWRIERQRHRLLVQRAQLSAQPPQTELLLQWHGEPVIDVPQWRGRLVFDETGGPGIRRDSLLAAPLSIRARSGGERIRPVHGRPSRSLKNLFQESGVPARVRPWLPLVYLGGQLVYAAGLGMDSRFTSNDPGVRFRWEDAEAGSA